MVAFRSSATGTQTPNTDGTSVTVTKPAGTASGDTLVAVVHGYLPATLTAPSGWILINGPVADGTALYSWLYQKIAGGSEPSNYTWTWSGAGGALGVSITAFSSSSGICNYSVRVTTATDPSPGTDIYPIMDSLGYHVLCWRDSTADTATASGVTEAFDFNVKDAGVIWRGSAGYYNTSTTSALGTIADVSIDTTNSIERGIHWTIAVGDSVSNESWSSSGQAVELDINGTWTDITSDVQYEEGISITRGQSGEASSPDVSRLSLTLDNRTGNYSPRNPAGSYFGSIGRNTPIRVAKAHGTVNWSNDGLFNRHDRLVNWSYDRFHTVDKTSLLIAADIDVRVDVEPRSWNDTQFLMGKWSTDSSLAGLRQWAFVITTDGKLALKWSTDGTTLTNSIESTLQVPTDTPRKAVRVTIDVNNGAAGHTVTFYTSDTIAGSWTQLGDAVVTSGTTSIYAANPAQGLTLGAESTDADDGATPSYGTLRGRFYGAELYSGIAGTKVADIDFTGLTTGTKTFTDVHNNIWIGMENAIASNRRYRFYGEISNWPQRWDSTGNYVYVPIEASGIRRRLESGSPPVRSAMARNYIARSYDNYRYNKVVAYWPCEDETGATEIASGLPDGKPMKIVTGTPTFANDSRVLGSKPLITLNNASFSGTVPTYTSATNECFLRFYFNYDNAGISTLQNVVTLNTSGTAKQWIFGVDATSAPYLIMVDEDGNSTTDVLSSMLDFGTWGTSAILDVSLKLAQSGSDITYQVDVTDFSSSSWLVSGGVSSDSGTLVGETLGVATKVTVHSFLEQSDIGHIAVGDSLASLNNNASAMVGTRDEPPATRFVRLAQENLLTYSNISENTNTRMGIQGVKTTMDLIKECTDTDHGIFFEPRTFLGLGFFSLPGLYNRPPALELDYSTFDLSGELLPEEDDQLIKNDATIQRDGGGSARYALEEGPLSTEDPPNGVGIYDTSETLSLYEDDMCLVHAGWVVHRGTVDESRYPKVTVALENPRFVASSALRESALNVDIGDRIVIANPPSWIPPEDISLLVVGYTETFDQFQHRIDYVCVPYSPYNIAITDNSDTTGRVDTDASSLSASATSGATSLSVATTDGYVWIDSATYSSDFNFDIMVGGERMTVTAITGTSSPQTFTVTRAVNGISKTHAAGTEVHVFEPIYVGF